MTSHFYLMGIWRLWGVFGSFSVTSLLDRWSDLSLAKPFFVLFTKFIIINKKFKIKRIIICCCFFFTFLLKCQIWSNGNLRWSVTWKIWSTVIISLDEPPFHYLSLSNHFLVIIVTFNILILTSAAIYFWFNFRWGNC